MIWPAAGLSTNMWRMGRAPSPSRLVLLAAAGLGLALAGASGVVARAQAPAEPRISFNRDIRPILSNNCFACHGPDEAQRETKFHFDTKEGAFAEDGIIEPGNAAKSVLVKRITNPDPDERMPPPDSGHALTEQQIALLRQWIDEGAVWDTHWAYTAPDRPEPPVPAGFNWVRNPIDQFVLARLESAGLTPSPEADRETLLRRVTYDLTGLPPTPAEIDAFLADAAPDAYERRVDALLQSPRYGERMAVPWLDAARYADTHGFHIDSLRGMWPWRDWVIDAFNRNLPFDQFAVEQLAGDLLPDATREQKIASGFNRNHMINFEGGAIAEEYQVEYVVDRVEATSTAFMGMTMGCARCHTHKFDPISHKEFYQFFAFFNNVPEVGLDGRSGNAVPFLPLPDAAQQAQLDEIEGAIEAREAALAPAVVAPLQAAWESALGEAPRALHTTGLSAYYELDGSLSDLSGRYQHGRTIRGDPTFEPGQVGRALSFDGDTAVSFGSVGGFDRAEPFSLSVWLKGRTKQPTHVFRKVDPARPGRGYEWFLDDISLVGIQRWAARLTITLTSDAPAGAIQVRTRERLNQSDWYHVAMTYNGSGTAAGLTLYLNGAPVDVEVVQDKLAGPIATDAPLGIAVPFTGQIDDLRLYTRALAAEEIGQLAVHYVPRAIASGVTGKRSKDEAAAMRDYFLTFEAPGPLRTAHAELKALKKQKLDLEKQIPTAMVMAELKTPRDTFVLARGDYRNQTDKVQPGVPAILPALPKDAPLNRLTLARWLVASEASAHLARGGEPLLADVLRHRPRQDAGRLRRPGGAALAPGAPRLAGHRVHPHRLGRARDAAADRHLGRPTGSRRRYRRRCSSATRRTGCSRGGRASGSPPR